MKDILSFLNTNINKILWLELAHRPFVTYLLLATNIRVFFLNLVH